MGMKERLALKRIREEVVADYDARLQKILGRPMSIQVDWAAAEGWTHDGILRIETLFDTITDALGSIANKGADYREELSKSLKEVRLVNIPDAGQKGTFVLEGGVVEVRTNLNDPDSYGLYYVDIQNVIEDRL